MQDKKKIVIGTLCALIMIMAVGYALLSQQLSITGSAAITSNWQVEITNIRELEKSTGATTNNTNHTATTASFNTSLTSPGDYALYEVTVTNKGTLDAVLSAKPIVTTGNNEAIQYELEGIKKGDKILKNNQTDTFTIKVTYNSATTTQPSVVTGNIELILNYQQDLGQVIAYEEYSIGDVVEFNNSNWRVIKQSSDEEDYVTLMKETVLTNAELGTYAYNSIYDTMKYHDSSNVYATSKVKEFLEGDYLTSLGANKLKSVELNGTGYKVRLITKDELENLGCIAAIGSCSPSQYGSWVYQNFGEGQNNVGAYWTMTPRANNSSIVWVVTSRNSFVSNYCYVNSYGDVGVRPVINLLKSEI